MALVTSHIFSDIRGKVAGSVFQKSAAGLTFRKGVKAVNVKSPRQMITRNILKQVHNAWHNLTPNQRTTWSTYANFWSIKQQNIVGNQINGQQLFIKIHCKLFQYDKSVITNPTFNKELVPNADITVVLDGGDLKVQTNRVMNPAAEFIYLSLSGPYTQESNHNSSRRNRDSLMIFTTTAAISYTITSQYLSAFGVLPNPGDFIFMKAILIDLGTGMNVSIKEEGVPM